MARRCRQRRCLTGPGRASPSAVAGTQGVGHSGARLSRVRLSLSRLKTSVGDRGVGNTSVGGSEAGVPASLVGIDTTSETPGWVTVGGAGVGTRVACCQKQGQGRGVQTLKDAAPTFRVSTVHKLEYS